MKKLSVLLFSLLFIQKMNAQISLETTYPVSFNNNTGTQFGLDYYSYLGFKYYYWDNSGNTITIYNLNHSVNRVITIPSTPSGYIVSYLTTQLFDTDSTDFEYMVQYNPSPSTPTAINIYDENGVVLLHVDSFFNWEGTYSLPASNLLHSVVNTTSGAKLILTRYDQSTTKIYSLPGLLPCRPCGNLSNIPTSIDNNPHPIENGLSQPYPNPTNGSTQINYTLPEGETSGEIVFYDITGQEVKRFKVDHNFHDIVLTTTDLAAGTYYYQLQTKNSVSGSRKMVVIQ